MSNVKTVVGAILAVMTVLWLPYTLTDWTIVEAVGNDFGIMLGTVLFFIGGYDLAETAGVVDYP